MILEVKGQVIMMPLAVSRQNDTPLNVFDEPYDESVWMYEETFDKKYRYILGTKGQNPLICFGVNPSTASPSKLDKTISNIEVFAKNNHFDSYVMLNLYPQRATDPQYLDSEKISFFDEQNFETIRGIFSRYKEISILAAWGVTIEKKPYLAECLKNIVALSENYNCNWLSLGLTKAGHPRHPSRLSYNTELRLFEIEQYMAHFISEKYDPTI